MDWSSHRDAAAARRSRGRGNRQEGSKEMIRKLKVLGLSLVALAAIGAVSAASASAVTDVVTVNPSPALLTGVGHNHVFKRDVSGNTRFECTTSKFAATVKTGESTITADAEYEGTLEETPHKEHHCNAAPVGTVTIDMNGCSYILEGETTGKDVEGKTDATVWIECPAGKVITITSSLGIKLTVPPQTPTKGGVTFTNLINHAGGTAVNVKATATGITTICEEAFGCGLAGIPTHSNDYRYDGDVAMTAFKDEEGLPTPVTEGPRASVSVS
jgi:hypothetical protein